MTVLTLAFGPSAPGELAFVPLYDDEQKGTEIQTTSTIQQEWYFHSPRVAWQSL